MDSFFSNDDFLILPVINNALQGEIKSEAKRLNVGRSEESEQVEIRKFRKIIGLCLLVSLVFIDVLNRFERLFHHRNNLLF